MERFTMFLLSLLMLLVAIHVTLTCNCRPLTLGQSMCSSTTVVLARLKGKQFLQQGGVPYVRYDMNVTRFYRTQRKKLIMDNGESFMLMPEHESDCGGVLFEDTDYVLVGNVNDDGELLSGRCYHFAPYEKLINDQHVMSILRGEVDCRHV